MVKQEKKQKNDQGKRQIKIDYLYIDLSTCNRCLDTDTALYEAIRDTSQILKAGDIELVQEKILIDTEEQCAGLGFFTSPTIRINGRDIQPDFQESVCESDCGVVDPGGVLCREWKYKGKIYNTAPKQMIVDAILKEVYGGEQEPLPSDYYRMPVEKVPDNLKHWFAAKRQKTSQGQAAADTCGPSCCEPAPAEAAADSCCGPAPVEAAADSCCGPAPAESAAGTCCAPAPTEATSTFSGTAISQNTTSPSDRVQATVQTYQTSYPCAQSLLSVYADEFGLDKEGALKVAAPFVGGMGMMGETCGAVTGAFMALGLKYGGIKERGKIVSEMQKLVTKFVDKFEARNGAISCEKLLGVNISTPEGFRTAADKGLLSTLCPNFVRDAAEITEEILGQSPGQQQATAPAKASASCCGPAPSEPAEGSCCGPAPSDK
ncbi:MAG: C-GCAxxG-C-C family protein [Deltaproteobacteria bacterium]|nr:MAG: C-GCAxxG-C-C family protein [Deltaproteobacteria bacterium]